MSGRFLSAILDLKQGALVQLSQPVPDGVTLGLSLSAKYIGTILRTMDVRKSAL